MRAGKKKNGGNKMRKMKRSILRHRAEKLGVKPSLYVLRAWERLQKRKVGAAAREVNKHHGTKPKKRWRLA